MRVTGGADRGRKLAAPRGLRTRPTAERVREALFDILGPAVAGMRVLDLFAGTGAIGIEALSRGAARAVFVERDRAALRTLRANLAALRVSRERARVVAGDAITAWSALARSEAPFDLVFLDPPYAGSLDLRGLEALASGVLLRPGGQVVIQHSTQVTVPAVAGLIASRTTRRFGGTALTFLRTEGYTPPGSRP